METSIIITNNMAKISKDKKLAEKEAKQFLKAFETRIKYSANYETIKKFLKIDKNKSDNK